MKCVDCGSEFDGDVHSLASCHSVLLERLTRIADEKNVLLAMMAACSTETAQEAVARADRLERARDHERERTLAAQRDAEAAELRLEAVRARLVAAEKDRDEARAEAQKYKEIAASHLDDLEALGGTGFGLVQQRDEAEAKADALKKYVIELTSELDETRSKLKDVQTKLDAELPAAWREDLDSLNECLERMGRERDEASVERDEARRERDKLIVTLQAERLKAHDAQVAIARERDEALKKLAVGYPDSWLKDAAEFQARIDQLVSERARADELLRTVLREVASDDRHAQLAEVITTYFHTRV